ncbi:hypothetical protein EA459_03755 [Streptococcus dysgalactiae subsp. dysgalactiae]|nr:hypothetical protein [Streptococcus dysgalactiae]QGG97834.1 hypothetical protein EA459_03755 [Streptococcus dysgalactiae subsp. dysgalactiae]
MTNKKHDYFVDELSELPESYKNLIKAIPIGLNKAKPTKEIASDIHQAERKVRERINHLINVYSFPICATRKGDFKGIYIPRNGQELKEGTLQLEKQVEKEVTRLKSMRESDPDSAILRKQVLEMIESGA